MTSGIYSQGRYITEVERDSAYSKIIRGRQAIEQNVVYKNQIKTRDSIISIQTNIIGIQESDIQLLKENNDSKDIIITNQKTMITNEKKRGRRKGFYGFIKGVGVGALGILLLTL